MALIMKCPSCKKGMSSKLESCPHCEHVITEEEREKGIKDAKASGAGCWLLIAVIALVACIAFFVSGDDTKDTEQIITELNAATSPEEKSQLYKDAVKSIDKDITDVRIRNDGAGRGMVEVFYTKDIALSTIYTIGMNTRDMSEELAKYGLIGNATDVFYYVHVPTLDKLGNEGTGLAMKIGWSGQIISQINWKNMFAPQFLNLANYVEIRHLIKKDVLELYQNPEDRQEYARFLQMALQ